MASPLLPTGDDFCGADKVLHQSVQDGIVFQLIDHFFVKEVVELNVGFDQIDVDQTDEGTITASFVDERFPVNLQRFSLNEQRRVVLVRGLEDSESESGNGHQAAHDDREGARRG